MNHSCWLFLVVTVAMPAVAQSPAPGQPDPYPDRAVLTFKTGRLGLTETSQALSGNDWNGGGGPIPSVAFGPPPEVLTQPRRPAADQLPEPEEQSQQRNAFALTIKTGYVKLADDSQTISRNDWLFERSGRTIVAIEGETRLSDEAKNFSLGGEVLRYENAYGPASAPGASAGTLYTHALLLKSKYYFLPGSAWQPYMGGGLAWVWSYDYSGPLHTSSGLGFQGVVGMQWRTNEVGLRVEYMGLRAPLEDPGTGKLNASSRGLFVGVSFFSGGGGRSQPEVKTKDTRRIEVPRF